MTEEEWLACGDPRRMLREGVIPSSSRVRPRVREYDLLCAACARLVWHLLPEDVKLAIEWQRSHRGLRR